MTIKTDFLAGSQDATGNVSSLNGNFLELETLAMVTDLGCYNMEPSTRKFRTAKNPIVLNIGDSISEGRARRPLPYGGISAGYNWTNFTANSLYGKLNSAGYASNEFAVNTVANWTLDETRGYNLRTMVSGSTITNMPFYVASSEFIRQSGTAELIYMKMPDGGGFDIINGSSTVIATLSCNGTEGIFKHTFAILDSDFYYIRPKSTTNPTYVCAWNAYQTGKSHRFLNCSKGGRQLVQFSNTQITEHMGLYGQNLTMMSLGANDYGNNSDLSSYYAKVELLTTEAKSKDSDVVFVIMIGNSDTRVGGAKESLFTQFKSTLYTIAKNNNCGVIDLDKIFGGNQRATDLGYMTDGIHPNNNGNIVIAGIMSLILFDYNVDLGFFPEEDKTIWMTTGMRKSSGYAEQDITSIPGAIKVITDLGSGTRRNVSVLSSIYGTTAQRPVSVNRFSYMQYFDTTLNKPIYFNGTNWVDATGTTV